MNNKDVLISNIDKLHTTRMGVIRIKKNLNIETNDVVLWCKDKIIEEHSNIYKEGKNWYITNKGIKITVNSYSYTIITAHKVKEDNK